MLTLQLKCQSPALLTGRKCDLSHCSHGGGSAEPHHFSGLVEHVRSGQEQTSAGDNPTAPAVLEHLAGFGNGGICPFCWCWWCCWHCATRCVLMLTPTHVQVNNVRRRRSKTRANKQQSVSITRLHAVRQQVNLGLLAGNLIPTHAGCERTDL